MYENDEGDLVLLAKDGNSLSIAVQSSRKIPGVDLKGLKLKVLECTSPSSTAQGAAKQVPMLIILLTLCLLE